MTLPSVIGITGKKQSGKDTVATRLAGAWGYTRIAYADALRDAAYALNPWIPLSPSAFYPLADLVDIYGWDVAKTTYPEVRRFLQRLGTDAIREHLGSDVWVDAARRKVDEIVRSGGRVVLTDVRFPNEVPNDGPLLRVVRESREDEAVDPHSSETALDTVPADWTITNDGTVEDLYMRVDSIMRLART